MSDLNFFKSNFKLFGPRRTRRIRDFFTNENSLRIADASFQRFDRTNTIAIEISRRVLDILI
jgi:hypothetical protein